jgi:hypothetical protein
MQPAYDSTLPIVIGALKQLHGPLW